MGPKPVIVVNMHGGTIDSLATNIPGLAGVQVVFTEAMKYLTRENETEVVGAPMPTGIYTVNGLGDPVDCLNEIVAASNYGESEEEVS